MSPEIQHAGPSKPIRAALRCVEVLSWVVGAVFLLGAIGLSIDVARGNVPLTVRLANTHDWAVHNAQVDGGVIDLTLASVPLEASWAYLLVIIATGLLVAFGCLLVSRLAKGVRRGAPFSAVSPRALYVFAAAWTALSVTAVVVLALTQNRMAESVGANIPGTTFVYSPDVLDIGTIALGPVAAIVIAIFASGSKMWAEHRVMV